MHLRPSEIRNHGKTSKEQNEESENEKQTQPSLRQAGDEAEE